jgi:hypothetical protein
VAVEQDAKLWKLRAATSLARLLGGRDGLAGGDLPARPSLRLVHRGN